jgi:hypothetical protein
MKAKVIMMNKKILLTAILITATQYSLAEDKPEAKAVPEECKHLTEMQRKDPNGPCLQMTTVRGSGATEAFVDYVVQDNQNGPYAYTPSGIYIGADTQTNTNAVKDWSSAVSSGQIAPKDGGGSKEPGTQ